MHRRSKAQVEWDTLEARHKIRTMIMDGEAQKAYDLFRGPSFLNPHSQENGGSANGAVASLAICTHHNTDVDFFLQCLAFIELIRYVMLLLTKPRHRNRDTWLSPTKACNHPSNPWRYEISGHTNRWDWLGDDKSPFGCLLSSRS